MAIAVGQKRIDSNAAGGSVTTTGVATQASGSLFLIGAVYDSGTFTSLGDNKGNTYTQIGSEVSIGSGAARGRWYYVQNGAGGAGHTVSLSSTGGNCAAWIIEITGAALTAALGTSNQVEDAASPFTSPSITPAAVNGMLVAFHVGISTSNPATHAETGLGSSTIQVNQLDGANIWPMAVATAIKSPASGSYASSWTETGGSDCAEYIAFFLEASSAAAASAGSSATATPGLSLGRPTSKLRSARETSQIGSLSALGLSSTTGVANLVGLAGATISQVTPSLGLGTPRSRLRSAKASDQLGQISALGISTTVGTADLPTVVQPTTDSRSIRAPGMALGTPVAKLKSDAAGDQVGQLSSVGISATVGMAALTGDGALSALGLSSTVGQANLAGTGALSALGLSSTVGSGELTGAGALAGLGLSVSVGSADLQPLNSGAMEAPGLSVTVGTAEISYTFTPPDVVAATGSVPGFVAGGKKKRRNKNGPVMREDQVFGEEYPVSPFTAVLKSAAEDEQSRRSKSYRAAIAALMRELL